jgi:ketosteroid isomerase-like protein
MRRRSSVALAVVGFAFVTLAALSAAHAREQQADADVIATERGALERWGNGDPGGFLSIYAPEITYIDPSQERRIDGLAAMTAYLAPLKGKIHIDRFEILNPKVQRHGDVAVLSYNVVNYQKQADGTERTATRWNSTAVFRRIDGKWRTIHSHFSFTKPELKQP